jgi:hypothetical protein
MKIAMKTKARSRLTARLSEAVALRELSSGIREDLEQMRHTVNVLLTDLAAAKRLALELRGAPSALEGRLKNRCPVYGAPLCNPLSLAAFGRLLLPAIDQS